LGRAPGKFIKKAREHIAAAKAAKHETTASTGAFAQEDAQRDDAQQAEEETAKEQPVADESDATDDQDDAGSSGEKDGW
jgi:hypothetical protein